MLYLRSDPVTSVSHWVKTKLKKKKLMQEERELTFVKQQHDTRS